MTTSISSAALLVELTMSAWSGIKTDRKTTNEVEDAKNAKRGAARVQKFLLGNCDALSKVTKHQAMIRKRHLQLTLPWLDTGVRLLPAARYFDYVQEMGQLALEQEKLVGEFLRSYHWEVTHHQLTLGDLFDESEYPSSGELATKFRMKLTYLPVPESGDWRVDVSNSALDELRKHSEAEMNERLRAAMQDIWQRMHEALSRMSERLSDDTDGEHKVFRDSLVTNALEVLDVLATCNITNDPDMERARQQLASALKGVSATALRDNESLRKKTKVSIDQILKELPGLMS